MIKLNDYILKYHGGNRTSAARALGYKTGQEVRDRLNSKSDYYVTELGVMRLSKPGDIKLDEEDL